MPAERLSGRCPTTRRPRWRRLHRSQQRHQRNGTGACVECLTASTCPGGADTTCATKVCTAGFCDISLAAAGTVDAVQMSGDARRSGATAPATASQSPTPTTSRPHRRVQDLVLHGMMPETGNAAHGMSCTEGGGRTCDSAGACINSFSVLKLNATNNTSASLVIEERRLDG